jgi:hypothetical protein
MIKLTSKQYFKGLSMIYLALVLGQAAFAIIVWILVATNNVQVADATFTKIFFYEVPGLTIACIIASNLVYKYRISKLKLLADLSLKMTKYRGVVITRFAILEGASFFAIITVMLTGDERFLVTPLIIILCFFYWRPRITKIETDLDLNPEEISRIENPDSIIIKITTP